MDRGVERQKEKPWKTHRSSRAVAGRGVCGLAWKIRRRAAMEMAGGGDERKRILHRATGRKTLVY